MWQFADLTHHKFVSNFGHVNEFFVNPAQTSLYRFKQKLLHHFQGQTITDKSGYYFITLTVDDQHYHECFRAQSPSQTISKFLTKTRNRFKYHGFPFEYAWRLERGSKGSQRYHYHIILQAKGVNLATVEKQFMMWDKCQWDQLSKEESVKPLTSSLATSMYISTYSAKWTSGTIMKLKSEFQTHHKHGGARIYGTSRGFRAVPEHLQYKFDKLCSWSPRLRFNFRKVQPKEMELIYRSRDPLKNDDLNEIEVQRWRRSLGLTKDLKYMRWLRFEREFSKTHRTFTKETIYQHNPALNLQQLEQIENIFAYFSYTPVKLSQHVKDINNISGVQTRSGWREKSLKTKTKNDVVQWLKRKKFETGFQAEARKLYKMLLSDFI